MTSPACVSSLPPLGLYIHLPWCERKCPYCDFNSHERDRIPEQDYIDALLSDLKCDLQRAGQSRVDSIFIGGGTPSLFSAKAIERLLLGIRQRVDLDTNLEITLEANPGSSEADKFMGFKQAGITRLSLGIQSFNDKSLQTLGRIHDAEQAHRAVTAARAAGFKRINLDLMHGLPDQDQPAAVADLEQALSYDTGHISWYQLTVEPNTHFYSQPPLLPVEDELAAIQEAGEQTLTDAGYRRYEVSAWSREGQQCRHNLNYWRFGDYLGIGAGAHGKLSTEQGVIRYRKTRQPEQYMQCQGHPWVGEQQLQAAELRSEFILNALRMDAGFDLSLYQQRTGLNVDTLQPELDQLIARGLLSLTDNRVTTTTLGQRFLDTVVAEFIS